MSFMCEFTYHFITNLLRLSDSYLHNGLLKQFNQCASISTNNEYFKFNICHIIYLFPRIEQLCTVCDFELIRQTDKLAFYTRLGFYRSWSFLYQKDHDLQKFKHKSNVK